MSHRKNRRPGRVERLETRHMLASTVEVVDLVVEAESDEIAIVDLGDGTIQVTETGAAEDGSDLVQVLEGVEGDIIVRTQDGTDDSITLDLSAGSVTVDDVKISARDGDNVFAMLGGSIEGDVRYRGGDGVDLFSIAEGTMIGGNVSARVGGGDNIVEIGGQVDGGVRVRGGDGDDTITLLAESLVGRGVRLSLGGGDNTSTLDGSIDGRLGYRGGDGNDRVALGSESVIGDDVRMRLGEGDNTVTVGGSIAGDLSVISANEDDSVEIGEDVVMGETELGLGEQVENQRERGRGGRRGFRMRGMRR